METPRDLNSVLNFLLSQGCAPQGVEPSVLTPEDEAYLIELVASIRLGKSAVLIVADSDDKLKYMFSNSTRAEAVSMLGKVIEATGRRLASGEE
ncbi:MAG: hypothetical protein M3Z07_02170 [Candidatus Eremiobacteraeota bacterium]|nr:hypothetical protein [Candidatus Eremiobacteraeota bacterium]